MPIGKDKTGPKPHTTHLSKLQMSQSQSWKTKSKQYQKTAWMSSIRASPGGPEVKNLPAVQEPWVRSLGLEDPLKEGMATYSNILAWRTP